jgi:S1-C subfamily serine protease
MTSRLIRIGICLLAAAAMVALLATCAGPSDRAPDSAPAPEIATAAPAPAIAALPQGTARPPAPRPAAAGAAALTPVQVFAAVAPSVAFVELPDTSGSGFLIEGGYLVTNAHVVWPYAEARVVFPDGSEHKDVPVVNWDLLADLAVLGPIESDLPPLALADGEGLPIGSEVYLIGYPGEVEKLPQPTITRGVVSRHREWDEVGLTYLQSDARIIGGQSGGVLVSEGGQVIGVSGIEWDSFAMVASAADLAQRIDRLIAGEDTSGLGDRRWQLEESATGQEFVLDNSRHARFFVLKEPGEAEVEISLSGSDELTAVARTLWGEPLGGTEPSSDISPTFTFTTYDDLPVVLEVRSLAESPIDVSLSSSADLYPQEDPDDGRVVGRNQVIAGNLDYPGDLDYYKINLTAGDEIELVAEAQPYAPRLWIDYRGAPEDLKELAPPKDAMGDSWQTWTYKAPHTGRYFLVVENEGDVQIQGYVIQVKDVPATVQPGKTPLPDEDLTRETLPYRGDGGRFSIRYPKDWQAQTPASGVAAAYASEEGGALEIVERDMIGLGLGKLEAGEYTNQVIDRLAATAPGFKLLAVEPFETAAGLTAEMVTYSDLDGARKCAALIHLDQARHAFTATYCAAPARYRALESLIQGSFRSFAVEEGK